MRRLSIPLPVSLVLSMLLSISAGFVYSSYGWHNGLLFLLMAVVLVLSVQKIKRLDGPDAVAGLIPLYMESLAAAVVSVLCAFAGIHLGGGEQDLAAMACYAAAVALFGFTAVCTSVNHAVWAADALVSPVFKQTAVYIVAFIAGLVAVAADSSYQLPALGIDAVVSVAISLLMMSSASKGTYC